MKKTIKYFLNGKEVDKSTISKRKDTKLVKTFSIEEKYYDAPLNTAELEQKIKESKAASDYFQNMSDNYADMQARN